MYYSHINELCPWVPFSFGERQILDHYKEFVAVSLFLFFCALLWPECSKETLVCVDSVAVSIHRVVRGSVSSGVSGRCFDTNPVNRHHVLQAF